LLPIERPAAVQRRRAPGQNEQQQQQHGERVGKKQQQQGGQKRALTAMSCRALVVLPVGVAERTERSE